MRGKIIAGRYLDNKSAEIVIQVYEVPTGQLVLGDEILVCTQHQDGDSIIDECEKFVEQVDLHGS